MLLNTPYRSSLKPWRRLAIMLIAALFMSAPLTETSLALSKADYPSNDVLFYDPESCMPGEVAVRVDPTIPGGEYIEVGEVPKAGVNVGARVYGGKYVDDIWKEDLKDNVESLLMSSRTSRVNSSTTSRIHLLKRLRGWVKQLDSLKLYDSYTRRLYSVNIRPLPLAEQVLYPVSTAPTISIANLKNLKER